MKVENGNYVQVHYTGSFDDGTVFDSSEGKEPLETLVGHHMLIKGFDNALLGMDEGEEKEITVTPADAYGERHEELVRDIPLSELGPDIKPEVGMTLGVKSPEGHVFPATVKEVTAEKIVLDANHPLAGKTLHFKLKVVSTRVPSKEDLQRMGHDHGPEAHAHDDE